MQTGTAWAAALIRISFSPLEKFLCCQHEILLRTLSLISLKNLVFFLPIIDGRSRYFSYLLTILSLKMSFIAAICPHALFLLKKSKLKICPEAFAQQSNIFLKCLHSATDALTKIRQSSANRKCNIVMSLANLRPRISYFISACTSKFEKAATYKIKRYGTRDILVLTLFQAELDLWGPIDQHRKTSRGDTSHYQIHPFV